MSRKALFFDVDGTLLSGITRTVPESAVRALSETRKKGNLVFINSGRVWCHFQEIKDMVEADGYLCGCGTYVWAEGKEIYHYTIPCEQRLKIRQALEKYGVEGILEARDHIVIRQEDSGIAEAERLKSVLRRQARAYARSHSWEDAAVAFDKFCLYAGPHSDRAGLFRLLEPEIQVIDRGSNFYECVPAGHSKATGIQKVLDVYGLEKKDAYVFGDSSNDLAMFEYADNAILMGHHDAVLEPYASFVTKTVEEDGIAYAMERLGLV